MKQVREISDCSAYIVLNKKGGHVATVQLRYGSGGGVQCDVWSRKDGYLQLTHQKKAGGYGYDKATAAMAGAIIEGFRIADHCGQVEETGEKKRAALMRAYKKATAKGPIPREAEKAFRDKAEKIGCHFANYAKQGFCDHFKDQDYYTWQSLHNESGLRRLEMLGFRVISAI